MTGTGRNDTGLFDTGGQDARYLPFKGSGAISTWRLELPTGVPQFDHDTITDVILHLRYTARAGGAPLRDAAEANLRQRIATAGTPRPARPPARCAYFPSATNFPPPGAASPPRT